VADVPSGLSLTPPRETIKEKIRDNFTFTKENKEAPTVRSVRIHIQSYIPCIGKGKAIPVTGREGP
jgi:hypothetical protein